MTQVCFYLFLPGIFSIMELTETVSQRSLDLIEWLRLFHPVPVLVFTGDLCQSEKTDSDSKAALILVCVVVGG